MEKCIVVGAKYHPVCMEEAKGEKGISKCPDGGLGCREGSFGGVCVKGRVWRVLK